MVNDPHEWSNVEERFETPFAAFDFISDIPSVVLKPRDSGLELAVRGADSIRFSLPYSDMFD